MFELKFTNLSLNWVCKNIPILVFLHSKFSDKILLQNILLGANNLYKNFKFILLVNILLEYSIGNLSISFVVSFDVKGGDGKGMHFLRKLLFILIFKIK